MNRLPQSVGGNTAIEPEVTMATEIIVALITLCGSALGTFTGIVTSTKMTNYRIGQLERKVEKHNSIVERTYILEEQMKVANHRIADLEDFEKEELHHEN